MSTGTNNKFSLRPTEPSDAALICTNRNNDWGYLHVPELYSKHETEKWLQALPSSSRRYIVLIENEVLKRLPIGIVRVDHIDFLNGNCYVGMDIFEDCRGKGYSDGAYKVTLDYLFNALNMHIIYLEVLATNPRAIHVYEKLGFQPQGRFPQKLRRNGTYVDSLIFSLLRSDYVDKKRASNG